MIGGEFLDAVPLHIELFEALYRLRHVRFLESCPLSKAEFMTLGIIARYHREHPDETGIYVSALADYMHCSAPAASRTLRHLEERGLLRREADQADRRNTCVILTEEGRRTLDETFIHLNDRISRVIQRMGKDNMRCLIDQLDRLADAIQEEQQRSEPNAEYSQVSEKTRRLRPHHRGPSGGAGVL